MILTRSEQTGQIDVDEVEMIESVFELGDTIAREIMVPRPDVETVSASMSLAELRSAIAAGAYTRYPVLEDDTDQPLGFVHAKDVLRASEDARDSKDTVTAGDLARPVLTVPETRRIDAILSDFQGWGQGQLSVVVDEWGVFEGIVTLEDILEEIVGDIRDEFDTVDQEPSIEHRDDGTYVVDGGVPLQEVNERLNAEFASPDVQTIGGFVFSRLGRVPRVDDRIEESGYVLQVAAVEDTRIDRLVIRPAETDAEASDGPSD